MSGERSASAQIGVLQAQLFVVITMVVLQLWLLTVGLEQLLAGNYGALWSLAAFSALAFLIASLVSAANRGQ